MRVKKFFDSIRRLSSSSPPSTFNQRRLSMASIQSMPSIRVIRGGYNIDLQKVDSSFTKLHKAVYLNNVDRVRKHLRTINVNSVDNFNRTPMHYAACNGNLTIIKQLMSTGANLDIQDCDGRTPLIKAVECGHNDIVRLLVNAGAKVDLADNEHGNTALHYSLLNDNLDAALYIISNAMNIDYNKCNRVSTNLVLLSSCILLNVLFSIF